MHPLTRALVVVTLIVCAGGVRIRGDQRGAAPPVTTPAPNPDSALSEAGTGTISGVVIDGTTKAPLPGAVVYLGPPQHGPPGAPVRQITDAKGRFLFRGLPEYNGYFISASRFGYLDGRYGRGSGSQLGGRIAIGAGQWFRDATVALWRPAAINGRVVDQLGEPVVGVYVRALARVLVAGRPHLAAGAVTTTDDRGMYRLANLAPGTYLAQVPLVQSTLPAVVPTVARTPDAPPPPDPTANDLALHVERGSRLVLRRYLTPLPPKGGRARTYPPTFHPGTTSVAAAGELTVDYAEDRAGVDIRLEPVETFQISGRLEGPAEAMPNLLLRLMPAGLEELGDGSEAAVTVPAADGTFALLNVPAGAYTLDVRHTVTQYESRSMVDVSTTLPRPPGLTGRPTTSAGNQGVASGPAGTVISTRPSTAGASFWARLPLSVTRGDVSDLVVPLQRSATMRGRFVWEGERPRAGTVVNIRLEPAGGDPTLGVVRLSPQANGSDTFVAEGLLPGAYVVAGPAGRVKSVTWNGRDYTDRPFDVRSGEDVNDVMVTFTDASILLSGVVRDDRGTIATGAAVIVFPVESERWTNFGLTPARLSAVQVANDGRYRFGNLPAGEYYVIAVEEEQIDGWKHPSFLERAAPRAAKVSLAWGGRVELSLQVR